MKGVRPILLVFISTLYGCQYLSFLTGGESVQSNIITIDDDSDIIAVSETDFELIYPFQKQVSASLLLRNRDGEEARETITADITLSIQSGGSVNGDIRTQIPQTIDGARFQILLVFFDLDGNEVFRKEVGPYWTSRYRSQERTQYLFESSSRAAVARRLFVTILSRDDWSRGPDAPSDIVPFLGSTPSVQVFILPGMLGNSYEIERVKRILESSTDPDGAPIIVRIWDWTKLWLPEQLSIQDRLYITEQTCWIGERFANAVVEWRNRSVNVKSVHLIALSAGTMVAKGACGARNGIQSILDDQFFGTVLLLSGALDIREPWDSLAEKSIHILNYYSLADQVLATRFPTFLIFRIRVSVAWPACGGVGLKQGSDSEARHIHLQLGWVRRESGGDAEELGNNGGHLAPGCLAEPYFRKYLLPVFTKAEAEWPMLEDNAAGGWALDIHPDYNQDQTGWGLPNRGHLGCR